MLEAQCGQSWELKTPGGPTNRGAPFFAALSPGAQTDFHSKYQRNFPSCF